MNSQCGCLEPAAPTSSRRSERERTVLAELCQDGDAEVAFQGLRRRLGLHPQALIRTLRRLERDGLLVHGAHGYRLSPEGCQAAPPPQAHLGARRDAFTVLRVFLPPNVEADKIEAKLAGRWFRGLRWYGKTDALGEQVLQWLLEDGHALVRVRIAGGVLSVEMEGLPEGSQPVYRALPAILAAVGELLEASSEKGVPVRAVAA